METLTPAPMSRPYQRRSSDQKIADLEKKIATLKARQEAREKKSDPVLKEAQKLHKRLKAFIQIALDQRRRALVFVLMLLRHEDDGEVGRRAGPRLRQFLMHVICPARFAR